MTVAAAMTLPPNDWNAIRAFYREAEPDILAAGSWEWGIDPYLWHNGMIWMTPIEEFLWHDIRAMGAVLYPQYPVGRFFVDFANPAAKVAIECDGAAYHLDKAKDARRDAELAAIGWRIYRAPGWLCLTDSDPETGKPGEAHEFIRRICEAHGISRGDRPRTRSEDSQDNIWQEVVHQFQRDAAIDVAMKRAASFPHRYT